jgi:hypothetical protein
LGVEKHALDEESMKLDRRIFTGIGDIKWHDNLRFFCSLYL